jgi:hypothetical protein
MGKLSICCQTPSAGGKQQLLVKIIASHDGRTEKDIYTTLTLTLPAAAQSEGGSCFGGEPPCTDLTIGALIAGMA